MRKLSLGFTLLEMLIVLVIIGISMMFITNIKQKKLEEAVRRQTATLITQEIAGIMKFIHEDEISVINSSNVKSLAINPLYDITGSSANLPVYRQRVSNNQSDAPLQGTNYIEWQGKDSSRGYFISSSCGAEALNKTYNFENEYIGCKYPGQLESRVLNLSRIDLVGDQAIGSIERADFIINYKPMTSRSVDRLTFDSYKVAFEEAFNNAGLSYSNAHIVVRPISSTSNNAWKLLEISSGNNKTVVNFGNISSYISNSNVSTNQQFGIRITVDAGAGKYLKSDGSVGADKLCWNIDKAMTGPCVAAKDSDKLTIKSHLSSNKNEPGMCWDAGQSKSTLCLSSVKGQGVNNADEKVLHLTAEDSNGTKTTGTLMANVIIEKPTLDSNASTVPELTTIPVVSYAAFSNTRNTDSSARVKEDYAAPDGSEPGQIQMPVQTCPLGPGNRQLYPRIAVAISSIASDLGQDANKEMRNYQNPANTRSRKGGLVSDLSSVALQTKRYKNSWNITATTAMYDRGTGEGVNYRNPSSLSVVITTWCSSISVAY